MILLSQRMFHDMRCILDLEPIDELIQGARLVHGGCTDHEWSHLCMTLEYLRLSHHSVLGMGLILTSWQNQKGSWEDISK